MLKWMKALGLASVLLAVTMTLVAGMVMLVGKYPHIGASIYFLVMLALLTLIIKNALFYER